MIDFFSRQTDYIFFFYGISFAILSLTSYLLIKEKGQLFPWIFLLLFGMLQGLHGWLDMLSFFISDSGLFKIVRITAAIISFVFFAEFGRISLAGAGNAVPGRSILILFAGLTAIGGFAGTEGLYAASRYTFGLAGGYWASRFMFVLSKKEKPHTRGWLIAGGLSLCIYALLNAVSVPTASFFPASYFNSRLFLEIFHFPVQLAKGFLICISAAALWGFSQSDLETADRHQQKPLSILKPVILIFLIIISGWAFTEFAGNHAKDEEMENAKLYLNSLKIFISDKMEEGIHESHEKSANPVISAALGTGFREDIRQARALIDDCRHGAGSAVKSCYLLDIKGNIVAQCSGADKADREIYNSLRILSAVEGNPSVRAEGFFAVDSSSKKPAYYASSPVWDTRGRLAGILTIKEFLDIIEEGMKEHPYCFLIDPDGVIFLSSIEGMHLKALWPLKENHPDRLAASGPAGSQPSPLFSNKTPAGGIAFLDGKPFLVSIQDIGQEGWAFVLFSDIAHIAAYRFFGIFLTLVFAGLTTAFFVTGYFRKKSSLKIAASEQQYRTLIEHSNDMIWTIDTAGCFTFANKRCEEISGHRSEEWHGRNFSPLVVEDDLPMVMDIFKKTLGGQPQHYDVRIKSKDGAIIILSVNTAPIYSGGNITGTVSLGRDITANKQAEESLRKYHDHLEEMVLERTQELTTINFNLWFENNERKKAEEELKVHRERLSEIVDERTAELKETVKTLTGEIDFRRKIEDTLKDSETKFRRLSGEFHTLLDAINDELFLLSPDLKILWANKSAAFRADRKVSGLIGTYCFESFHNRTSPCRDCCAARTFLTGNPENAQMSTSDNRLNDIRAFPIKGEDSSVTSVIVIASDVTEKTKLQADSMRASHLALIGELAAGVAHEINNPINGIINYAQILANKNPEESREYDIASRIIKEGDRIASIVRGLLSFAREKKEEKTVVNIRQILYETVTLLEAQLRKDGIRLMINFHDNMPEIIANQQQIQQVLMNIISNARHALNQKFTDAHEDKAIEISGELFSSDNISYARLVFYDHGTGISGKIIDKVKNPFFTTKKSGQGTGLGLSISHGIIKDHNGRLIITSEEGIFTKVIIDIPAKGPDER